MLHRELGLKLGKPVVLVGMMGVGKTAIGKKIAKDLGWVFYDTDHEIAEAEESSVSEIFANQGEKYFRMVEENTIQNLLGQGKSVISTGGGAVTSSKTMSCLQRDSIFIWVHSDLDVLCKRLANDTSRPLLAQGNVREKLCTLLEQREDLYAQAHFKIENNSDDLGTTLQKIYERLADFML